MAHNPYETLGVPNNASNDEIKSQFRRLALRFHPDKSNSKYAEENFKEISEAYEILSDPIKREIFDKKESSEEAQKTKQPESARNVWWKQLKTMGKELLRLLQNYAQSMNEKQNCSKNTQKSRIFDYEYENEYEEPRTHQRKYKNKRKQENFEDHWVNASEEDSRLANDIFGVETPRKKHKGRRNHDYGFNMEDVFDL